MSDVIVRPRTKVWAKTERPRLYKAVLDQGAPARHLHSQGKPGHDKKNLAERLTMFLLCSRGCVTRL